MISGTITTTTTMISGTITTAVNFWRHHHQRLVFRFPGIDWCVSRPDKSDEELQVILDMLCGKINCLKIQPGGPCFEPNTVRDHTNFAINLYYTATSICDSDYAQKVTLDPSTPGCTYS